MLKQLGHRHDTAYAQLTVQLTCHIAILQQIELHSFRLALCD